jgi:hypothetical protein
MRSFKSHSILVKSSVIVGCSARGKGVIIWKYVVKPNVVYVARLDINPFELDKLDSSIRGNRLYLLAQFSLAG